MPQAVARSIKHSQDRAHRAVVGGSLGFFVGSLSVWGGCTDFGIGLDPKMVVIMVMAGIVAAIPGALIGTVIGSVK
jgi:hypothetical protein